MSVEIEKIVDVGIWRFSGDFRVHLNIIAFCAVFCANATLELWSAFWQCVCWWSRVQLRANTFYCFLKLVRGYCIKAVFFHKIAPGLYDLALTVP